MPFQPAIVLLFLAAVTVAAGCAGDASDATVEPTPDAGASDTDVLGDSAIAEPDAAPAGSMALTFEARVGDQPFSCATTFGGFGPDGDWSIEFLDARLYVHEVELLAPDGEWVEVDVVDDTPWQNDGIALLDFEDRTGTCGNGTTVVRTDVQLDADPEVDWQGVRFTVGVPFKQNHGDASVAAAPLNYTALFWNWQGGYKFVRADINVTGPEGPVGSFNVHIGSTGCDGTPVGGVNGCANPNRSTIELRGFNPATSPITVQLGSLYAGLAEPFNTADTPPGCMSGNDDPECGPVYDALGLGETDQTLFGVAE
jgi:uncharacterized repeat protein (TIGR04052 family)